MEIKEKHPEQVDPAERTSGSGRATRDRRIDLHQLTGLPR